jgi:hypothetical protein
MHILSRNIPFLPPRNCSYHIKGIFLERGMVCFNCVVISQWLNMLTAKIKTFLYRDNPALIQCYTVKMLCRLWTYKSLNLSTFLQQCFLRSANNLFAVPQKIHSQDIESVCNNNNFPQCTSKCIIYRLIALSRLFGIFEYVHCYACMFHSQ